MANSFTLGIEEEFQLVKSDTGELCSCAKSVLDKGAPYFQEQIKPEMLQSTVELISDVLPDMETARTELHTTRSLLVRVAAKEGLSLVSAGTHPTSSWHDQETTDGQRYIELEQEYQDLGRSMLIFGLHVHVGIENKELGVKLMNQVRTWLPQLLAISSNSPFWSGRDTGIKSYRSIVWKRFPRSGMPDLFESRAHFDRYVQELVDMGCIDNGKKIWWDVRPHPFFDTVEFRICDMPLTIDDTLAIAALCQALVAKLTQLDKQNKAVPVLRRDYIDENKWRSMRYGLDADVIDFVQHRCISMRDSIRELLDFVDDVVDDLGSTQEMNYLRTLMDSPDGTGADRQLAVYKETGDIQSVNQFLMEQTMKGITLDDADLSDSHLKFKMYEEVGK